MKYGDVLMHYMSVTGLSKAEIARRAGIGRSQITDFCTGRTKEPTLFKAKAIADALGVPLQEMVDMMYGESEGDKDG